MKYIATLTPDQFIVGFLAVEIGIITIINIIVSIASFASFKRKK